MAARASQISDRARRYPTRDSISYRTAVPIRMNRKPGDAVAPGQQVDEQRADGGTRRSRLPDTQEPAQVRNTAIAARAAKSRRAGR